MEKITVGKAYRRDQLADYLESLAAQLRSGSLQTEAVKWQLPETFDVETQLKEKKDSMKLKLEIRWHPLQAPEHTTQGVVRDQSTFKQIKKDLGRCFKEVKLSANQDAFINEQVLQKFAAHSRAFAALAEPEWQEAVREFLDHLENLFRAVEKGDKELVLHEISDLQNRMIACHKEFG